MLAIKALFILFLCAFFSTTSPAPAREPGNTGPAVVELDEAEEVDTGEDAEKVPQKIVIPIPVGQDARGIKIPSFNEVGVIQMEFSAGEALRVDEDVVKLDGVAIELYDNDGTSEFRIEMAAAEFDMTTQILSTAEPFTVRRSDFLLEGKNVQFDTGTRQGRIEGQVKMTIYDNQSL